MIAGAPTQKSERIVSLDVLRGIAILGILIMNIQSFAMISSAYMNPTAFGDFTGWNRIIWTASHIIADQKFLTIFSMLFGAGIVLMAARAEQKGVSPARLHYRRTLWLIVIGLIHAYGLWYGDILVSYGLCALLVFLFRKLNPWLLLILGILAISLASLLFIFSGWSMQFWPEESIEQTMTSWHPDAGEIEKEVTAYRGSWLDQMPHRAFMSFYFQVPAFLFWTAWRAGGCMLFGMALMKWGFLSATRSTRLYLMVMIAAFSTGFPLILTGLAKNSAAGWSLQYAMFFGSQYNYWGSLFVAVGYISLIMLICRWFVHSRILKLLAGVGRTALSNYLFQTVICTTIFYGYGLGLYGHVDRVGQIGIMLLVWILEIILTTVWLKRYRFGPVEWLWRSLTYGKRQPLRRKPLIPRSRTGITESV
ncbi:MAG TPA: DUF418 domain-containing protein [bacterium]|nr:DUF418 domain-containing protein [bacterium]